MHRLTLSIASAFVLAVVFVATAAADSHTPATGATTVTAVPQTGTGSIAASATSSIVLLLVGLTALMTFAAIRQARRA